MSQTVSALIQLRELILSAKLRAGDRISEQVLVKKLRVSRTPIRSALQRLEAEGLCRIAQGGGYEVNTFSIEEVVDAINVRGALEGMAARSAAERGLRRADLTHLKSLVTKMDDALRVRGPAFSMHNLALFGGLNDRFHALVVHFSGNIVLQRVLQMVMALPFVSPSAFVTAQSQLPEYHDIALRGQRQHHELLRAIEGGEIELAEQIAREHAGIAKGKLRVVLENETTLKHVRGWSLIQSKSEESPYINIRSSVPGE